MDIEGHHVLGYSKRTDSPGWLSNSRKMRSWCFPHNEYELIDSLLDSWQKYINIIPDFQALVLGALMYPLDRIQSIQQVQTTYSNSKLRNSEAIVSTGLFI